MKYYKSIGAMICLGLSLSAYPWGQKGHDTVAFIAENHLSTRTKAVIDSLLGGKSIVYYSNWLDNASHTPEYEYSKTWHYMNIDSDETYRSAMREKKGDVVRAITLNAEILADSLRSADDKALALKMLVHLVGDIHQPMHMGRRADRGGNNVNVKFFGSKTNLHRAWDSQVLENGHKWSYSEWQQQIDRATPAEAVAIIEGGNSFKWGEETYEITKQIYAETPYDTNIEYNYIARWTPVIEQQLLKGGLRLADLLNYLFDNEYNAGYSPLKK